MVHRPGIKVDSRPGNCDVIVLMETGMGGERWRHSSRGSSGWRHRRSVHPARCIWSASVQWRHCIIFFSLPQMFTSFFRQFDIQKYHVPNETLFSTTFLSNFSPCKILCKEKDRRILFRFTKFVKYYYYYHIYAKICDGKNIHNTCIRWYSGIKTFFTILRNEILICNKFRFLYLRMIDL